MQTRNSFGNVLILATAGLLCSCAVTETLVTAPTINLASVEIGEFDFQKQTFLLEFDVQNANSFSLPINKIR